MDSKSKIVLRYAIAVFLGSCTIHVLKSYWKAFVLDKVACVALFSCIISVTGEDESLGPVLYKLMFRSLGVLIGGFSGYLLLYFPTFFFPREKDVCLLLIPAIYITLVQYIAKWNAYVSGCIKRYKAGHLLLQLQMAFGVIYVGSWDDRTHGFHVAITRICAIWVGSVSLLIASLVVFPQTSLHLTVMELCECMHLTGKLANLLCHNKMNGHIPQPYDYNTPSLDEQSQLLEKIETKLSRVAALSPFLIFEPAWIPGLPLHFLRHKQDLVRHWCPFLGVLRGRLVRIRATLTVMDSNIRIDSCRQDHRMRMKSHLGEALNNMCAGMGEALEVIAAYISSPFSVDSSDGWRGSLDHQDSVRCNLKALRGEITDFTSLVLSELQETNTLRRQNSSHDIEIASESQPMSEDIYSDSSSSPNSEQLIPSLIEADSFGDVSVCLHRDGDQLVKAGGRSEHVAYHRLSPMRAFCNMAVQCAVQLTSVLQEADIFVEKLRINKGEQMPEVGRGLEGNSCTESANLLTTSRFSGSGRDSFSRPSEGEEKSSYGTYS